MNIKDLVQSMISYEKKENDEVIDEEEALDYLEDYFSVGAKGLKVLGINYDYKSKSIILMPKFNLKKSKIIMMDYFNSLDYFDDPFSKKSFKEFIYSKFSKNRAKNVYDYYEKSGAITGGDDTVFDYLGTGVIIAIDVLEVYLKKK